MIQTLEFKANGVVRLTFDNVDYEATIYLSQLKLNDSKWGLFKNDNEVLQFIDESVSNNQYEISAMETTSNTTSKSSLCKSPLLLLKLWTIVFGGKTEKKLIYDLAFKEVNKTRNLNNVLSFVNNPASFKNIHSSLDACNINHENASSSISEFPKNNCSNQTKDASGDSNNRKANLNSYINVKKLPANNPASTSKPKRISLDLTARKTGAAMSNEFQTVKSSNLTNFINIQENFNKSLKDISGEILQIQEEMKVINQRISKHEVESMSKMNSIVEELKFFKKSVIQQTSQIPSIQDLIKNKFAGQIEELIKKQGLSESFSKQSHDLLCKRLNELQNIIKLDKTLFDEKFEVLTNQINFLNNMRVENISLTGEEGKDDAEAYYIDNEATHHNEYECNQVDNDCSYQLEKEDNNPKLTNTMGPENFTEPKLEVGNDRSSQENMIEGNFNQKDSKTLKIHSIDSNNFKSSEVVVIQEQNAYDTFENKVDIDQKRINRVISSGYSFNLFLANEYYKKFKIKDKSITKIAGGYGWSGFSTKEKLNPSGTSCFKIRVNKTKEGCIMIGCYYRQFVDEQYLDSGIFSTKFCWMTFLHDSRFYAGYKKTEDTYISSSFDHVQNGDQVEVKVNLKTKEFTLLVNEKRIASKPLKEFDELISYKLIDINNIYFCLDLYDEGDSITIID